MQPKQAKEQIMRILEQSPGPTDNPMRDIVTIFKAMAPEKRKKILGEFKNELEIEKLHDILHEIRLGGADAELLRDTRSQLQQQASQ
jgi:hypothetical protein